MTNGLEKAKKLTGRNDIWVLHTCPDCHFGRIPAGVFGPATCKRCAGTGQIVAYGGVSPYRTPLALQSIDTGAGK